ncbi:MAG: HigA family addiction module antitoxin [Candidatus Eisenbacteria bacterium]|nr:HigA family addiction module antitoxin [Candidatus Eisenbacteria bacterium]
MRQRNKRPTFPGEILRDEFLAPLGLTQKQLADHLGCDLKVINRIVNGSRVTVAMARRLSSALGTTPEFWLTLQMEVDLFDELRSDAGLPGPIGAV